MAAWTCKLTSSWVGTGSRFDRYRPLFQDEYVAQHGCAYNMLSGDPPAAATLDVTLIPDDATADLIAADERFPSWDWAEIPQ